MPARIMVPMDYRLNELALASDGDHQREDVLDLRV